MKKYLLSGAMVFLFVLYLVYQRMGITPNNQVLSVATPNDSTLASGNDPTTSVPTASAPPANSTSLPAKSTPHTIVTSGLKDGTYTGTQADAYYGYIQVQAIIQNGKLADVQFLQYPNDQGESIKINTRALPLLRSEAIIAQSANVAIVSRATDSSQAFRQSLASALSQAKS